LHRREGWLVPVTSIQLAKRWKRKPFLVDNTSNDRINIIHGQDD